MRLIGLYCIISALAVIGCNSEIYVRDGVTDGDTFYLAERALSDDDPVLQSWVSYSLTRSTCQLQIGGDNPARNSSFDCELSSRRLLLDTWLEKKVENPGISDDYLDGLLSMRQAGYLREYVAKYHRKRDWDIPTDIDVRSFNRWRRQNIPGHKPETRIIGSWNYASR